MVTRDINIHIEMFMDSLSMLIYNLETKSRADMQEAEARTI